MMSGVGALATGMGTVGQGISSYFQNQQNMEAMRSTNKQNERLMREGWAREDNAVQRRTADLRAAGLSPVLAAGGSAQSMAPIQLNPVKSDQDFSAMGKVGAAALQYATMQNMAAQKELIDQQITESKQRTWKTGLEGEMLAEDLARYKDTGVNPQRGGLTGMLMDLISGGKKVEQNVKDKRSVNDVLNDTFNSKHGASGNW